MDEAHLSTFDLGPASLLLDGSPGQPELVLPAGGSPVAGTGAPGSGPDACTLLCPRCWTTFEGWSRQACPRCQSPKPGTGWASMPYTFRGRYVFWRLLGRGGMGAVFLAYDEHQFEQSRKAVAVKVVPASGTPSLRDTLRRMFEREASAGAMLAQSPNFVKVTSHDIGVDPAYLVMEYVDWPTLRGLLRRGEGKVRPLSPIKVARIGIAALRGLATMHFHRMVHRDLKPDNIFVRRIADTDDYEIKILDFGVWTYDASLSVPKSSLPGYSKQDEGSPVGTYAYMSPEQMASRPVGARSDVHSIGSVLWELATGKVPYGLRGKELTPALRERMDRLRRPPDRPSSMPEGLYDILARALAFEARERWESADEMKSALKVWLAEESLRTRALVEDARQRFAVLGTQVTGLSAKLTPARELGRELEALSERLQAYQRNLDEALPDALRRSILDVDDKFKELSARLDRFAEGVKQGVEEGEAATGDLSPLEIIPSLPASVAIDLDEPGEPVASSAIQARVSAPEAKHEPRSGPETVPGTPRPPRRAPWIPALAGAAVALGAFALAASVVVEPRAPEAEAATEAPEAPTRSVEDALGPGHASSPIYLAWSDRGDRLASASADGVVRWFGLQGEPIGVWGEGLGAITTIAQKNGQIWAGIEDGRLILFDLRGRMTPVALGFAARAIVLSEDGADGVVFGARGERWRVWYQNAKGVRLDGPSPEHAFRRVVGTRERALALGPDGTLALLVDGAEHRRIRLSGAEQGTEATALALGGGRVAVGDARGGIELLDAESLESLAVRPAHEGPIVALAFAGDALVSAGADQVLRVHAARDLQARGALRENLAVSSPLVVDVAGRALALATRDRRVVMLDLASGASRWEVAGRAAAIRSVRFDGEGRRVLAAGNEVRMLDARSMSRLLTHDALHADAAALGPDGHRFATIGRQLSIFEPDGRRSSYELDGAALRAIAWPDALLLGDAGGRLLRVQSADGAILATATRHEGPVEVVTSGREGTFSGGRDGHLLRVEPETLDVVADAPLGAPITSLASAKGRVAVGLLDGRVLVRSAETLASIAEHTLQEGPVRGVALSPDASTVYVGTASGHVLALRADQSGVPPTVIATQTLGIAALDLSPDGLRLAVGGLDGTVRTLDVAGGPVRWESTRDGEPIRGETAR